MQIKLSKSKLKSGFTLLEILIALFIFTILSIMLVTALHTVIGAQSGTEKSAERLRQLQMTLLIMSRDIEQAANRPSVDASGKENPAFMGDQHGFTFTHLGIANPFSNTARSTMQRASYTWDENVLSRITWDAVDQAAGTKSHTRELLTDVPDAYFEYLDNDGKSHEQWPLQEQKNSPLPRAVRIHLTIKNWGKLSQLYVIPMRVTNTVQQPPQPGEQQGQQNQPQGQSGGSQH